MKTSSIKTGPNFTSTTVTEKLRLSSPAETITTLVISNFCWKHIYTRTSSLSFQCFAFHGIIIHIGFWSHWTEFVTYLQYLDNTERGLLVNRSPILWFRFGNFIFLSLRIEQSLIECTVSSITSSANAERPWYMIHPFLDVKWMHLQQQTSKLKKSKNGWLMRTECLWYFVRRPPSPAPQSVLFIVNE